MLQKTESDFDKQSVSTKMPASKKAASFRAPAKRSMFVSKMNSKTKVQNTSIDNQICLVPESASFLVE